MTTATRTPRFLLFSSLKQKRSSRHQRSVTWLLNVIPPLSDFHSQCRLMVIVAGTVSYRSVWRANISPVNTWSTLKNSVNPPPPSAHGGHLCLHPSVCSFVMNLNLHSIAVGLCSTGAFFFCLFFYLKLSQPSTRCSKCCTRMAKVWSAAETCSSIVLRMLQVRAGTPAFSQLGFKDAALFFQTR